MDKFAGRALAASGKVVGDGAKGAVAWVTKNPGQAASAAVGVGGLAVLAVPAIVTAPLLAVGGFGAGGVVGSSIAAGVQSLIGNVVAGSWFATLMSAGAGGYGTAAVAGAAQAAGAVTAAGVGIAGVAAKLSK